MSGESRSQVQIGQVEGDSEDRVEEDLEGNLAAGEGRKRIRGKRVKQ